ncbi:uncharacterized protein F4807DRAFT_457052 [Annulohypoxylon truncatum]|uniref:uncharacterized protein n=1 Tax=Annulohypoxylon truncatum TaxID=327061 RepID=UPI0020084ECF|nr:uncharacterized protein F4807DRAFT_457052 [Annulohypoxylon truncatum]KAI1212967.1 hypothetical protein F4807DRAFT_457052 [Annulohypoxylon truncatum]
MAPLTDEEISEFIVHEVKPTTILVLLTSCQGTWPDTGFGGVLKRSYPGAYGRYQALCAEHVDVDGRPNDDLAGSCHIIPPLSVDHVSKPVPPVYIACIFSSFGDGHRNWFDKSKPGRSPKALIRAQTANAFQQMRQQLREMVLYRAQEAGRLAVPEKIEEIPQKLDWKDTGKNVKVCLHKFNGKDFQMDWEEVETIIKNNFFDWEGEWLFLKKRSEQHSKPSPSPSSGHRSSPSPVRSSGRHFSHHSPHRPSYASRNTGHSSSHHHM